MKQLHFETLTEQLLAITYSNKQLDTWKSVIEHAKEGKLIVAMCDKENICDQMISYFVQFIGHENVALEGKRSVLIKQGWGGVVVTSSHPEKDVLCYNPDTTFYYIYQEDQQWNKNSKDS